MAKGDADKTKFMEEETSGVREFIRTGRLHMQMAIDRIPPLPSIPFLEQNPHLQSTLKVSTVSLIGLMGVNRVIRRRPFGLLLSGLSGYWLYATKDEHILPFYKQAKRKLGIE